MIIREEISILPVLWISDDGLPDLGGFNDKHSCFIDEVCQVVILVLYYPNFLWTLIFTSYKFCNYLVFYSHIIVLLLVLLLFFGNQIDFSMVMKAAVIVLYSTTPSFICSFTNIL